MSKAVLLVNLGSPDSTSVGDVRRYLNEFLMDGRVIDTPWLLRRFIVGMILVNRPKRSRRCVPQNLDCRKVRRSLSRAARSRRSCRSGSAVPVELAMRYQNPSIPDAIRKLREQWRG